MPAAAPLAPKRVAEWTRRQEATESAVEDRWGAEQSPRERPLSANAQSAATGQRRAEAAVGGGGRDDLEGVLGSNGG